MRFIFFLSGCATIYNPATGRQEVQFITTQQEVSVGSDIAEQVEKKFGVLNDPAQQGRLNFIGQRLALVSDRRDLEYYFKIVNEKSFNAFTLPGGFIYVHKGLLDKMGSDSELASVLAHEIGHVAARHPAKALEMNLGYDILSSIIFHDEKYANLQKAVDMSLYFIRNGYGRQDELLADRLGVRYMKRAGYRPEVYLDVLKKLEELEAGNGSAMHVLFSDHPAVAERVEAIKEEIKNSS